MSRLVNIRTFLALVAVGANILVLSACGGEPRRAVSYTTVVSTPDVGEPSDTARVIDPARAAYIRRVDAVCARINPERERAISGVGSAGDNAHAEQSMKQSIVLAEQQLREVAAVKPPAADRQLIASNVIDRLKTRLGLRRKLAVDLRDDDVGDASRNRAQLDALTIALRSFARGFGFRVCGER